MNDLKGQTVVIVGGSSGMGLGTAQVAVTHGATVVIASDSQQKLDTALKAIHGQARAIQVDLLDEESVRQLFEQVRQLDHLFITAAPGARGEFLTQSRQHEAIWTVSSGDRISRLIMLLLVCQNMDLSPFSLTGLVVDQRKEAAW